MKKESLTHAKILGSNTLADLADRREGADGESFRFLTVAEALAMIREGDRRLAEAARDGDNAAGHRNASRGRDGHQRPAQRRSGCMGGGSKSGVMEPGTGRETTKTINALKKVLVRVFSRKKK